LIFTLFRFAGLTSWRLSDNLLMNDLNVSVVMHDFLASEAGCSEMRNTMIATPDARHSTNRPASPRHLDCGPVGQTGAGQTVPGRTVVGQTAGSVGPTVDLLAAEHAVRQLLTALGEDPGREGLRDTPRRVARAMAQLMAGRGEDPAIHLRRQFTQACDEVVILRDIEFFSLCEHHLLPFIGKAHIAYLPGNGKVVGLSKLARVVDVFARRPQLQEQMTTQIADALQQHAGARGVAVVVEAEHMCMKMRGACKHDARMQTFALRGVLRDQPAMRTEILSLLTAKGQ
jgi:GTP cyclohydrolase I